MKGASIDVDRYIEPVRLIRTSPLRLRAKQVENPLSLDAFYLKVR